MRLCTVCGRRFGDALERCTEDGAPLVADHSEPALVPGVVLDLGLTIERFLGAGPTGEVYLARDAEARPVAVKLLAPQLAADRTAMARLAGLLERLVRVEHPAVAQVLGQGDWQGRPVLVRELLAGRSAAAVVQASGPLETRAALEVAIRAAEGLAEAHRRGALHLNLRPSNLFLGPPAGTKLVDFGLGAPAQIGGRVLHGDPRYLSPEQVEGELVSFRSDIYGLGALLYFLLTGHPPFEGPPEQVAARVSRNGARPPSELAGGLVAFPELDGVVLRSLEKSPTKRYLSVQHFARALDALSQGAEGQLGGEARARTRPRLDPAEGATLEMGAVGRKVPSRPPAADGGGRTLEMGVRGREPDREPAGAPGGEGPRARHPRLERELDFDDTLRMPAEDGSEHADTLEVVPGRPNGAPPRREDDTLRTALPEAGDGAPVLVDPLSPLPPPRPSGPRPASTSPGLPAPPRQPPRAAPETPPAARRAGADTTPMAAPALPELEADQGVEVVTEEPPPEPQRKKRKRRPARPAELAVRPQAAIRIESGRHGPAEIDPADQVVVDASLLQEARGPERHHETLEIRLKPGQSLGDLPSARPGTVPAPPRRAVRRGRAGRVVLGVLGLVMLFVIAALAAAAVARWMMADEPSPAPATAPASGDPPGAGAGGRQPSGDLELLRAD